MFYRFLCVVIFFITSVVHAQTLTLPDGSVYTGELDAGLLSGTGELTWPNGNHYVGEFHQGQMSGNGVMTLADGGEYQGAFQDGLFHGDGLFTDDNKGQWQGRFERGEFVEGTLTDSKGIVREGQFNNWLLSGQGKLIYEDGRRWSGTFVRGVLNGEGQYEDGDGTHYTGGFVNWNYDGHGELQDADGRHYVGSFSYGEFNGKGELTLANGDHYLGEFEYGEYSGKGDLTLANGEHQVGMFNWGQLQGDGRIDYANGDWFEGQFSAGKYHGNGTWYHHDSGIVEKGRWNQGRLVAKQGENGQWQHLGNILEQGLYQQSALLAAQQAAVVANESDTPALYLLAVAGDGRQEVFRREVEYAKQLVETRFNAKGHVAMLINSKETAQTYPMATVTAIEQTLADMAEKMNPETDILMLYLTSHGSADHQLFLNQAEFGLVDLSADYLAQMLNNSPIKHKVVIISACYSGGFIDKIGNATTMVMTSADKDKTSFGCSDDADFTYFGRALLEQALQQTQDFRRAFHAAVEMVEQWEQEQELKASKPQLYAPAPLLEYLAGWYATLPDYDASPVDKMVLTKWWWREVKILDLEQ